MPWTILSPDPHPGPSAMPRTLSFGAFGLLLSAGWGVLHAQASLPDSSVAANPQEAVWVGTTPYVEGQVIVRLRSGADLAQVMARWNGARYFFDEALIRGLDLYLVRVLDGTPVLQAVQELWPDPDILYASPDHVVQQRQTFPNDPSFPSQWDKHNTGQGGGTPDADIDAPEAWSLGTGSKSFVVAVVDGGCDINHGDLRNNIYVNQAEASGSPGLDDDGNGYVDDVNGWNAYSSNGSIPADFHGTHVNGIAGARGNNNLGVAGVNWNVTLMPVAGASSLTSTVLSAYGYCCDQKALWLATGGAQGANVVATNSSFGIDFADCNASPYTQWNDAYNAMGAMGILSAAATANLNINIDQTGDVPTGCPSDYMVAVTNTTSDDTRASAGYGALSIDLGAPGTNILSTVPGGGFSTLSGTSMASPQVAGAVAFLHSVGNTAFATLRANDPAFAALEVKRILLENVDVIPALAGITVSDGRLNLHQAALDMVSFSGGSVVLYGLGLHGANIGSLTHVSGDPAQNSVLGLGIGGFVNSPAGALFVATNFAVLPALGGTVLIDLGGIVGSLVFPLAGGSGVANVFLPPGTAGFVGYAQAGALDPTLSAGFALTNGAQITVGM